MNLAQKKLSLKLLGLGKNFIPIGEDIELRCLI